MASLENRKHELFAQAIAKGESATVAYKNVGYSAKGNAAEACASRLLSSAKIQARVTELQERAAIKVETTAADIARQLDEDRALAIRLGQPSAAVSATLGKAKVLGLIVDKRELTGKDGGAIAIADVSEDRELVDKLIGDLAARQVDRATLQ